MERPLGRVGQEAAADEDVDDEDADRNRKRSHKTALEPGKPDRGHRCDRHPEVGDVAEHDDQDRPERRSVDPERFGPISFCERLIAAAPLSGTADVREIMPGSRS